MSEMTVESLQARIRELEQSLAQYKLDLMAAQGSVKLAQIQIDGMARTWEMVAQAQRVAAAGGPSEPVFNMFGWPAR